MFFEEDRMKKLVLIDGNSLLNRAFYATKFLSTKDGVPTNAVYGFVKLLLKITNEMKPDRLIVTFDLKAPTFRHKMYDQYKATRKPMPDDLAVQVGMLKELLQSMRIAICEKEGYEADDLIGTLSHMFSDTNSIIITGDRDSYQLIDERTEVYLTKTGVSELLRLNLTNFKDLIGYSPDLVPDMKALMGDASDNIPGVAGIGEKTALSLIQQYGDLDSIYSNLSSISDKVRLKLQDGKDSAYLSKKLATIDRNVPLAIDLEKCTVTMPFSEEVKKQFAQLEFTSLLKLDIFEKEGAHTSACDFTEKNVERIRCLNTEAVLSGLQGSVSCALYCDKNTVYVYCNEREYILKQRETLLDEGLAASEILAVLRFACEDKSRKIYVYGKKNLRHFLKSYGIELLCDAEDVSIIKYLTDYSGKDDHLPFALQQYSLREDLPAYGIYCLFEHLSVKLQEENLTSLYREIEMPLSDVLFEMEENGVKMDSDAASVFEKHFKEEIAKATEEIYQEAGEVFNINSPAQLGKMLFDKLKLPYPKKSKKGNYSTSADILENLAQDYKIVRDVLKCRRYQKLLSTYIDGFRSFIDPVTKLVHTTFNQVQTSTGRLSSLNPNLQNIPVRDEEGRELRKLFIARDEKHILLDADYSQIELRLLAHFSGCKELIAAYKEGKDIHALTASQVFNVPLSEVTPAQRRAAKAVNFGIIYGISEFGLAANLKIAPKQARDYIQKYFETYSEVKKYMDSNVAFAYKNGYVTTLSGRKRVIEELKSSNYNIRSFGERAAMNMPLQGSSADIIKIAMINFSNRLKKEGLQSKLILQVHDELVVDACLEEKETVAAILKYEMENAVALQVPLVAEVHDGKNWYEAK